MYIPVNPPTGIQQGFLKSVLQDLGFTKFYSKPYSHATALSDIYNIPISAQWIYIGCIYDSTNTYGVGVFGEASFIKKHV